MLKQNQIVFYKEKKMKHFMIMTMVLACVPFKAECGFGRFAKNVGKAVERNVSAVNKEIKKEFHQNIQPELKNVERETSRVAHQVERETSRTAYRVEGEISRFFQSTSEEETQDFFNQFSANGTEKTATDSPVSKSTVEVNSVEELEIARKELEVAISGLQIAKNKKKLREAEAKESNKELQESELIQLDLAINEAEQCMQKAQLRVLKLQ